MENVEELDQLVDVEDLNHVADDENGESHGRSPWSLSL